MRFVRMDKAFRGKSATEAALAEPLGWICTYLDIDGDGKSDGNGGEAVLSGGKQVGTVSSIAFGHGVGKLLAFAYVKAEHAAAASELEVVIMGEPRAAKVLTSPAYDAENRLPRTDAREVAAE